MARYRPSAYERGVLDNSRESALAGLLQSAVLKRFNPVGLRALATVRRMILVHDAFLSAWDVGQLPSLASLRDAARLETEGTDLTSWLEELGSDERSRPVADFEPTYRDHVESDRNELYALESALASLQSDTDPKLALLVDVLRETSGKAIVFASYGDTIAYLDEHLDSALGAARARVVIVGGEQRPTNALRDWHGFARIPSSSSGISPPTARLTFFCQLMWCRRVKTCSRPAR